MKASSENVTELLQGWRGGDKEALDKFVIQDGRERKNAGQRSASC